MIPRLLYSFVIILLFSFAFYASKVSLYSDLLPQDETIMGQKIIVDPNTPKLKTNTPQNPPIGAHSAIIIDAKTGAVLFQKNPDSRHLPASTTKLMTALIALENCPPETIVTATGVTHGGTQMGLVEGERITVENLLYGTLIASGNDAAFALAASCAHETAEFVASMNQKALELGMENSHFVNPAGFDDPLQYSTARDLAKLSKAAITNPLIAKIVNTKTTVVNDVSGIKTHYLENVNKLLGTVNGIEGIKTGQTQGSLEILISKTTRNNNSIIAVVLGSQDRFGESKQLIDWVYASYSWEGLD